MSPENLKASVIKLYLARNELEKSFFYVMIFILIYFALLKILDEYEDAYLAVREPYFTYGMIAIIVYCATDFLWKIFKYRDVLLLKHSEMQQSRCQCSNRQKSRFIICTSHIVEPLARRLEIKCMHCKKMIYHCNIAQTKKDSNSDFDINPG
jgi:hypothetical protein